MGTGHAFHRCRKTQITTGRSHKAPTLREGTTGGSAAGAAGRLVTATRLRPGTWDWGCGRANRRARPPAARSIPKEASCRDTLDGVLL
jgi:hypothetical protein